MTDKKGISLTESSSSDGVNENFDWVNDDNFPDEYKKEYLQFPLKEWREILFKNNVPLSKINSYQENYFKTVHKILREVIFKDSNFYNDKNEIIKYISNYYDKNITIEPDFFVHKMEKNKFIQLLNERKYMMRTNYQISENIEYISIFGEIKISRKIKKETFKNSNQKLNYKTLLEEISNDIEKMIVMYLYDNSFFLFKEDLDITENYSAVYCYIPKLYRHKKLISDENGFKQNKPEKEKINSDTDEKLTTKEYYKKEIEKVVNNFKEQKIYFLFLIIILISLILKEYFFH